MRVIDGYTIKINRGDYLPIRLRAKEPERDENGEIIYDEHGNPIFVTYIFKVGDNIQFGIYNKNHMSKDALLLKNIVVTEESETVEIILTDEEMKIGKLINRPKEYWYEVTMNGGQTLIGYDDKGAKILMLYPEGSEVI